ncbi:DUF2383 domain-containing protein [Clostridium cibarium]|uniref:DUF2383 domain-containing protein n=1 Tax=Clostridium cibarium TaxID=2762247 RepID=A0ABR8PRW7_9CLOT|nr:DUF2383 domain-containing protein [Clostridium cibarium]MBD7910924.1 DUF2383 domain-containing protein [Clostridium cibarium]
MSNNENVIHEMNKFLKGIHMGGTTFKDYLEKAKTLKLKQELVEIIESFKRHEEAITKRVNQLGGNASDSVGLMGMMGEFFEKVKLMPVETDEEVVEHAINAMNMGIKNGNKFIDEHKDLEESLLKEVKAVVDDYDGHLIKLKKLL